MQMTTEARAWLDASVKRILARHHLGDAERAGITYELMSHLHAAGEARAQASGRGEVEREDLEAALAEAGGEEKLAEAFVRPLSRPVERVFFARRLGAFLVDSLILLIAIGFIHSAVTMLAGPWAGAAPPAEIEDIPDEWGLMPFGFHDPGLPAWVQALIAVASAAIVIAYYTWFEANEGRTLGKRALGLRVLRVDDQPMTYREAFIRNLAKLSPPILFVDVLIMVFAFRKEAQRVSDRIAGTIVVRA